MITYAKHNGHYHICVEEEDTDQLRRIVSGPLAEVMQKFAAKNKSYGENTFPLGSAGQFPEVDRKVRQLKALIWDERIGADAFDTAPEVIGDLIGHLLMLLDCLRPGEKGCVAELPEELSPEQIGARMREMPIQAVSDSVGHSIREAKEGPETWVDSSYPPNFKGRHSYLVADVVDGVAMMSAHGRTIQVAGHDRCRWWYGDGTTSDDMRCVGRNNHGALHGEMAHINRNLDAWSVS